MATVEIGLKTSLGVRSDIQVAIDQLDAVDLVDCTDHVTIQDVDGVNDDKHDADFDAFASSQSLDVKPVIIETVENNSPDQKRAEVELEGDGVADQKDLSQNQESVMVQGEHETAGALDSTNDPTHTDDTPAERDMSRYVTPKDFELLKVIGMGAFGKVLQVRNNQSKKVLAMKVISKRLLKRKSGYVENVQAERDILTKVRHPFVVTMHCSFQTREKLFIIMDFLAGGELFLRLGREGIFLEKTAAFYLAECILALEHLHTRGVLHRDLKPENILLGSDGHVCLTDFGLAKDFSTGSGFGADDAEAKAHTICGTQEYMAPEMVARQGYGRAADYWSLGCIAYEMLNGLPPFHSKQGAKDLFRKIMTERVKMPPGSTAAACKLLKGLLNRNVASRLGASRGTMFEVGGVAALKKVDFFEHIDWDKLERKEVEPPVTLDVDNEEDLRHFHDEFTKMPLPRSVTEMNHEHIQPRHCQSDTFRGFSFIQDDFALPERHHLEMEKYWTLVEEDGESVSECASSKMGVDDIVSETPLKKKRPPRKRKKKKAVDAAEPMHPETGVRTPLASENGEPNREETSTTTPSQLQDRAPMNAETASVAPVVEPNVTTVGTDRSSNAVVSSSPKEPLPSKQVAQDIWQEVSKTPGRKSAQGKVHKEKWKDANGSQGKKAMRGQLARAGGTQTPPNTTARLPTQTPTARTVTSSVDRSYRPVPGSWVAKMSSSAAPLQERGRAVGKPSSLGWKPRTPEASKSIKTVGPRLDSPITPSSDWRKHAVARGTSNRSLMTPTNTGPPSGSDAWPSLSDFPPPPDLQKTNNRKPHGDAKTANKGAWGRR